MSGKYALIVANTEYLDPSLSKLTAPGKDAKDFAAILRDKEICAFDEVLPLINEPEHVIRGAIDDLFNQKRSDDLLVLYFSGHGIRDEVGSLYLAVHNTIHTRLRSTAIKSDYIRDVMDQSISDRQVLILDCCNSGAFAHGTKAATGSSVGTRSAFEGTGYGRVVLTASDATQLAWEGNQIIGETENSLFTHFLIQGLKGEADRDQDGKITVDDLYVYAYDQIISRTKKQTPRKWSYKQQGEIPLRQPTKAQIEKLRHLELEETKKRKQEELERERILREEQEIISKLTQELQITKETAEAAIREASITAAEERTKRKKAEREIELQRNNQDVQSISLDKNLEDATIISSQIRKHPYQARLLGFVSVIIVVLGFVIFLNSGVIQSIRSAWSPTESPIFTPQSLTFAPPATAQGQVNTPIALSSAMIGPENATTVVQLARWGKGVINEAIFSPDGKTIALASSIGIYLLDASNLQQRLFIETQYSIQSVAFTPDVQTIIAMSNYGELVSFRTEDGTFLQGSKVDFPFYALVKSSPTANLAAISGPSQTKIYLADLATGNILKILEPNDLTVPYLATVRDMSFSSDGSLLVTCSNQGAYLWNPNGTLIRKIAASQNYTGDYLFPSIIFSPDDTKVAFRFNPPNSYSSMISIYNTLDGNLIRTFVESNDRIGDFVFSPDGQELYYGKSDGSIIVRHMGDGRLLETLTVHTRPISHFAFAPDGKSFVSISEDGIIKLWNKSSFTVINSANGFAGSNSDIDISVSFDNKFVLSNQKGNVNIWEIATGMVAQNTSAIDPWIDFARFLSTRQTIAMTISSNILELWDYQSNNLTKVEETNAQAWSNDVVAISSDDQFVAISDNADGFPIYLYKIDDSSDFTNSYPSILRGHTDNITDVAFSTDSTLLVSGSEDETIRLWDVSTSGFIKEFTNHTDWISSVALSPAGTLLASSAEDGTLIIQRIDDGTIRYNQQFAGRTSPYRLTFSPDGQILAFSTYDGNIQLLSVSTGKIIQTLSGHTLVAQRLMFTSDGKLLITSATDGTIRIWGVKPK